MKKEKKTTQVVGDAQGVLTTLEARSVTGPLQIEDRKALALRLTQEIKDDLRNAIRKLGRVHSEKLWEELGYESFEDYVLIEFGHTRKWGYQQITRLKAVEALESKGVTNPLQNLSAEAALVFRKWENRPEVFTLAFQQLVERDEQPTQDRLEAECQVQNDYLREADLIPGLTQEEYRAYQRLKALPSTFELDYEFESPNHLVEKCRRLKKKPPLKVIARVARGADLAALVAELEPLESEAAKVKDIAKEIDALKEEKRRLSKDRSEIDKKRQEITEKIEEKQAERDKLEGVEEEGDQDEGEEGDGEEEAGKTGLKVHNPDDGEETDKDEGGVKYRYELWSDEREGEYTNQAKLFKKLKELVDSVALKPGDEATYQIVVVALDPAQAEEQADQSVLQQSAEQAAEATAKTEQEAKDSND